jgi:hypothetical protein
VDTKTNLEKKDYLWKRIKLGLWKRPDADEKEFARQDLAELTRKRIRTCWIWSILTVRVLIYGRKWFMRGKNAVSALPFR